MPRGRYFCSSCERGFPRKYSLLRHQRGPCYKQSSAGVLIVADQELQSSARKDVHIDAKAEELNYSSFLVSYDISVPTQDHLSIRQVFEDKRSEMFSRLKNALCDKLHFIAVLCFVCVYTDAESKIQEPQMFTSQHETLHDEKEFGEFLTTTADDIIKQEKDFQERKCGWKLHNITSLTLNLNKILPVLKSSFRQIPSLIKNRAAVINPQNVEDEESFKWAVLVPLNMSDHSGRIENLKKYVTAYDFSMIQYPINIADITQFEHVNNISINLFALDDKNVVFPVKVVRNELEDHRDLLILRDNCNNFKKVDDLSDVHFSYIKNFNRLVKRQLTKNHEPIYVCKQCICHFRTQNKLTGHMILHNL